MVHIEINFLKERIESLTDSNYDLKEENLSLSNQVELKFQETIFKTKKIEALQNENTDLSNKIEDLTKNNLTLQNDNLRFLDLKKFSEERENNLKYQINEHILTYDNLKEELNKEKVHTMTLNNKISEMEKIINLLQKDLNLSITEKNMLKYRNEQFESQLKHAEEENLFNQNIQNNEKKLFEQNKINLNNKIVALNEEISIMNQNNLIKTNQLEMRLKALDRENEESKMENKDLFKKLEIKEKNISDLFELINKIQNELKTKENLIRFLEDLVNEKEEIIISRKTKIIEITNELEMYRNTEKKLLSSEISFKGRELFNDEIILKRENEKLKKEQEIFCSKYNKIIEENNQLKLKLKTADQEKMVLEEIKKNMTEKLNQLELTLKLLEQDKNSCFNQNVLLSKQVEGRFINRTENLCLDLIL